MLKLAKEAASVFNDCQNVGHNDRLSDLLLCFAVSIKINANDIAKSPVANKVEAFFSSSTEYAVVVWYEVFGEWSSVQVQKLSDRLRQFEFLPLLQADIVNAGSPIRHDSMLQIVQTVEMILVGPRGFCWWNGRDTNFARRREVE
jgi:hypothetical protein